MNNEKRSQIISKVVSRAINNVPVSEVLRVYAQVLQKHLEELTEEELTETLVSSENRDLLDEPYEASGQAEL